MNLCGHLLYLVYVMWINYFIRASDETMWGRAFRTTDIPHDVRGAPLAVCCDAGSSPILPPLAPPPAAPEPGVARISHRHPPASHGARSRCSPAALGRWARRAQEEREGRRERKRLGGGEHDARQQADPFGSGPHGRDGSVKRKRK